MLDQIQVPHANPLFHLTPVDDVSLAFSLGITARTLWWLILHTELDKIEKGTGTYERFLIPKSKGSFREIHAPRPAMKDVQKAILATYLNPLPVTDVMGAYVMGRSIQFSALRHVGNAVKLSMDIKNFYGSTRRAWVRDWLRTLGFNETVVRLLADLTTVPVRRGENLMSVLPQGAPTSGMIANHVGHTRIDVPVQRIIQDAFGDAGWAYTRYSDNLEISFQENKSYEEMDALRLALQETIVSMGYHLSLDKVYIQRRDSPSRHYRVLGFSANEKLNIPKQTYRRLRAIVKGISHAGFEPYVKRHGADDAHHLYQKLKGQLIYWKQVSPWKIEPLLQQLETVYHLRTIALNPSP